MDPAPLVDAATRVLGIALPDGSRRNLNEANTRAFVIDPIIGALGYAGPDQIELEVPVGRSGQSLDYVITAHGIRIAVEAKSLQTTLADREASQIVGYIAQEGIRWAILTNGLDWHILDNRVDGDWQEKRVATIDLEAAQRDGRLDDALHPLALFARDALAGGDAELSAWSQAERARAHLDNVLGDPGSSAIKAIVSSMRRGGIDISPSGVVDLLRTRAAPAAPLAPSHHVAEQPASYDAPAPAAPQLAQAPPPPALTRRRRRVEPTAGVNFYLFPASEHDSFSGMDHLKAWLGSGMWGLWPSTPFRRAVKPGDQCCFYAAGEGVVATAEITATADQEVPRESWPGRTAWSANTYALPLRDIEWLPQPIQITRELRQSLDAFEGRASSAAVGMARPRHFGPHRARLPDPHRPRLTRPHQPPPPTPTDPHRPRPTPRQRTMRERSVPTTDAARRRAPP